MIGKKFGKSILCLTFGLLVCFITFGTYTAVSPFIEDSSNVFAQLCQVQIFFALLSSIALKFSLTETAESRERLDVLLTGLTFMPFVMSIILRTPIRRLLEASERAKLQRLLLKMCSGMKKAQTADSNAVVPSMGQHDQGAISDELVTLDDAAVLDKVSSAAPAPVADPVPVFELVGVASIPEAPAPAAPSMTSMPPSAALPPMEDRKKSPIEDLSERIKATFSPKEAPGPLPPARGSAEPAAPAPAASYDA